MKSRISIATALLSFTAIAGAQSAQNQAAGSPAKPSAYASPYQGTSQPADTPILADQAPVPAPSAMAEMPAPTYKQPAGNSGAKLSAAWQNPDAGIVTIPVPDDPASSTPGSPRLQSHVYNPDADIVTEVHDSPNQLPEGTALHARLNSELSADTVTPGSPFSAQLTQSVMHMGVVVIPAGSFIHGRVAYVSAGRRIGGASTMRLRPEEVVLPDGTHYHFRGIVTQTAGSDTRANSEGEVVAKGHPLRTASEYGMTAGSGAVIGGVVAGPVGVVAGAGIGAGLMTVHLLRQRSAAVMPAGSQVTFALSTSIALTASSSMTSVPSITSGMAATTSSQQPAQTYVEPKVQN